MIWSVPNMWEGGDVWILGGGPSIIKQFDIPPEVVQDVMNGVVSPSIYSPYMSFLHDKHVIGINVSYLIGDWIDMVFFGDSKFYERHKKGMAAFPGLKITCHPKLSNISWVKYLSKDPRKSQGISFRPQHIAWNCNSGAAAISVAANAGAKRIILLGFDMSLGEDKSRHWHRLYKVTPLPTVNGRRRDGRAVALPYKRHLAGFPQIASDAKARRIEIINASPTSSITVFPKCTVKELIDKGNG